MKSEIILLSVKPHWAGLIISGEKTVELRKSNFPDHVKKIVIYATKPIGEIVGIVEVDGKITRSMLLLIWGKELFNKAKVTQQELAKYYTGLKDTATLIFLKNPQSIRMSLGEIVEKAPQSFCYLNKEQFREICKRKQA